MRETPHHRTISGTWFPLLSLLALGCTGDPPALHASKTVGPAGASIQIDSGASLTIPPGALSQNVEIGIQELTSPGPDTPNIAALSPFFRLTPGGQTFAHPVSILLPFALELAGSQVAQVRVFHSSNGGISWSALPLLSHASPSIVGGQTTHFSLVVAGLPVKPIDDPGDPTTGESGEDPDPPGSADGCTPADGPGCDQCACEGATCLASPECCLDQWSSACVELCVAAGECGEATGEPDPPTPCEGYCDKQAPTGCHCDALCVQSADCCPDACATCGHCPPVCGDAACEETFETCSGCPEDCGPCSECGDGQCTVEESCASCPTDCGACTTFCGDNICTGFETCENCVLDCGECGAEPTCANHCEGVAPGGCWCDAMCVENGDCCADACALCDHCP
jgi:hypothetical protein